MANTKVSFITYEGETLKSYLVGQTDSTGTPNSSGYTSVDTLDPGLYLFTVPENLVGEFSVKALDNSSGVVFRGYINLLNDTNTYRCYDYTNNSVDANVSIDYDQINTKLVIPANSLPQITGNNISMFNGITWNLNISGIGANADDFYFTIKNHGGDLDIDSALQLNTSGITYFQNTLQNNTSGKLTYSSDNDGTINISINPVITSQMNPVKYVWDIKAINSNSVDVRSFGSWSIKESVTDRYE